MKPKPAPLNKSASWEMNCSPIGPRNPSRMPGSRPKRKTLSSSTTEKKLLTWHSTYGDISIAEQPLRDGRRGSQERPFCERAAIQHRGYSRPLQRALVDFGADDSFLAATKKVREHYGVELPISGARQHTLTHAKAIGAVEHQPVKPAAIVLTGMDGSMIRIVEPGQYSDKRKGKQLSFKQANLCCARAKDAADAVYGATMASVKMAGLVWQEVAKGAGLVERTYTHAVADGAEAIVDAFEEQFGTDKQKAKFTLDFYHVSEHLGQAAEVMAPGQTQDWLHQQQGRLLENQVEEVLKTLEPKLEGGSGPRSAPVHGKAQTEHGLRGGQGGWSAHWVWGCGKRTQPRDSGATKDSGRFVEVAQCRANAST